MRWVRPSKRPPRIIREVAMASPAVRPGFSYKLLGTQEWFVIHHTNCGMEFFTDEVMRRMLASSLETAELGSDGFRDVGRGPGSSEGNYIDWLTISDIAQSVVDDVTRNRHFPVRP